MTPIKTDPFEKETMLAPLLLAGEDGLTTVLVVGGMLVAAVSVGDVPVSLQIAFSNFTQCPNGQRPYEMLGADMELSKKGVEDSEVATVVERANVVVSDEDLVKVELDVVALVVLLVVVLVVVLVNVPPP
jgi:hypothetical protein